MTHEPHDREAVKEALSEAHRATRRQPPEFATLWSRAAGQMRSRRSARTTRLAGAAAALALAAGIGLWTAERHSRAELEDAMATAAAISEWRAPLDYLLDTPGRQWLETTPSWGVDLATEPWDPPADLLQEVPQ